MEIQQILFYLHHQETIFHRVLKPFDNAGSLPINITTSSIGPSNCFDILFWISLFH